MSWYKVRLDGRRDYGPDGKAKRLEDSFHDHYRLNRRPNAVLASKIDAEEKVGDHYFSPEAMAFMQEVVEREGGEPCDPPNLEELTYVAGDRTGKYTFPE